MKKLFLFSSAVIISAILAAGSVAMAQKKHAPKPVWGAMSAGLSDIQNITAALMVFDMKRATKIAEELEKREIFISKIERLPEPVRKGHAKVAEATAKLVVAAKSGEENEVANALNGVIQTCNACHYDLRDAERRKQQN